MPRFTQFKVYGNFHQEGFNRPELVAAYGDSYISLGFSQDDYLPARDSVGVYRFMVGDELGIGSDANKIIFCSFGLGSVVRGYRAGVIDTMMIQLETFNAQGLHIDIDGNFSIELTNSIQTGE